MVDTEIDAVTRAEPESKVARATQLTASNVAQSVLRRIAMTHSCEKIFTIFFTGVARRALSSSRLHCVPTFAFLLFTLVKSNFILTMRSR